MTIFFVLASVVAVLGFFIHTFMGGKTVARPLLEARSIPFATKWLSYYCWHIATVTIVAIAVGFAFLAMVPDQTAFTIFLSALSLFLAILSAFVAIKARINPFRFPSTSLFTAISVFGWLAIVF